MTGTKLQVQREVFRPLGTIIRQLSFSLVDWEGRTNPLWLCAAYEEKDESRVLHSRQRAVHELKERLIIVHAPPAAKPLNV